MSTHKANEKKYPLWEELANGGRRYVRRVDGHKGWYALYVKETDVNERTVGFRQEVYDEQSVLREIHEKFPVDKGHIKLK